MKVHLAVAETWGVIHTACGKPGEAPKTQDENQVTCKTCLKSVKKS